MLTNALLLVTTCRVNKSKNVNIFLCTWNVFFLFVCLSVFSKKSWTRDVFWAECCRKVLLLLFFYSAYNGQMPSWIPPEGKWNYFQLICMALCGQQTVPNSLHTSLFGRVVWSGHCDDKEWWFIMLKWTKDKGKSASCDWILGTVWVPCYDFFFKIYYFIFILFPLLFFFYFRRCIVTTFYWKTH